MIKPATPLPWITSHPSSIITASKDKIVCSMGWGNNLPMQDAEYIKTACNLFPELIEILKKAADALYEEERFTLALEIDQLVTRCGVKP